MKDSRRLWPCQPALSATLLLVTAISLSACLVAPDRDNRGDWSRQHHHWQNDRNWNHGPGWQDHHGSWNGQQ